MKWTDELRYRHYEEWPIDYQKQLKKKVEHSIWRLHYHIQPNQGLLNDPNGFSYFNQQWHLFYQSYPMGAVHGVKSWHHLVSDDLIHWKDLGTALLPDTSFDSHGVYSGSALPVDDNLFLMYTGNVRDKNWQRHTYQLGAWMNKHNQVQKISTPLIEKPSFYTEHFRDPQIIPTKDGYRCLIGAQKQDQTGCIAVYHSNDLMHWDFENELHFTDDQMGYMIECPNLVHVDDQVALLFCPQGLDESICQYQNIYPNMYVIGKNWDETTGEIVQPSAVQNLDEGFDVYATQAFNAPDGRTLAVSWIGLPEIHYPSDQDGWAHCLSLVKELTIRHQHLYQYPVEETKQLRKQTLIATAAKDETQPLFQNLPHSYELELEIPHDFCGTLSVFGTTMENGLRIHIDNNKHQITVDRSDCGILFAQEFGAIRTTSVADGAIVKINLFVDESVFELYINHGYQTMTGRIFVENKTENIYLRGNHSLQAKCYIMEQTN